MQSEEKYNFKTYTPPKDIAKHFNGLCEKYVKKNKTLRRDSDFKQLCRELIEKGYSEKDNIHHLMGNLDIFVKIDQEEIYEEFLLLADYNKYYITLIFCMFLNEGTEKVLERLNEKYGLNIMKVEKINLNKDPLYKEDNEENFFTHVSRYIKMIKNNIPSEDRFIVNILKKITHKIDIRDRSLIEQYNIPVYFYNFLITNRVNK